MLGTNERNIFFRGNVLDKDSESNFKTEVDSYAVYLTFDVLREGTC